MTTVAPISQQIWDMKYRLKGPDGAVLDATIEDTWLRVAGALSQAEEDPATWTTRFNEALDDFKFLPAGRIIAGSGTGRDVTLFNCFVMGTVPDDMAGIFENLKEAALTMQQGGGIGYDFSTIRPKGARVKGVGADASGPLTFMDVWDSMCRTIMSAGHRRGAMMATLRCDHPDLEAFIAAKRDAGRLRMFNLSVLVTDAFMAAVKDDLPWDLVFDGTVHKSVRARELWDSIMQATYAFAEPGVIFIDRINRRNNLYYAETICATNPCGEQPLPPYGACLLGSVNLTKLVTEPFEADAELDIPALEKLVTTAVRMLDNAIDVSKFPLPEQRQEAKAKRRIGLGITGLADALIMCGVRYGSTAAVNLTEKWMRAFSQAAYRASIELAREKGPFPLFDAEKYLAGESIQELDEDIRSAIAEYGIRNALLTSVAPTGTISLFADNISSGLEPVFSFNYSRNVLLPDGTRKEEQVSDYAWRLYRQMKGENRQLTDAFVGSQDLTPDDHVRMQAVVQKYIDSAVSKTINVPEDIDFDAFKDVYINAYESGCKGLTTYRPNDITGSVLQVKETKPVVNAEPELPLNKPQPKPRDNLDAGGVVYMTKPLDRPEVLPGQTYKVRWPESDHAIYITINDVINDGRRRPFEVFINSKNTEHYAWTVGLTRMISAVFRRGGDVSFVVEELKAVFDPRGGHWMNGRYVPSLLAAIGEVIEEHLIGIGFIAGPDAEDDDDFEAQKKVVNMGAHEDQASANSPFKYCPRCSQPSLMKSEGCDTCTSCGYSKCG
ncbi:MAG: adenosylcobalamin-dependent ribonucleoside-diphosphate reductase [Alphaproteobacteria bacterium]|jgi:ribonucleoside-diphosphate reductase alpha chain|nr:adenosylcobalamin-dependent ribonucleoside-diphosphate reductase [Alphaproteobacteria bacterium]MBT4965343.1 adenosylcobalamin-dependent ribonucleoside-diphosphate reductase [Alphaproteobacteria bacterium]MBT5159219.1 adenosylcobalamin-dependent ribonucleoside-diphosphate reductase [Alphaproteobacteria bacterium]MBT5919718.1 adenosylcobalamin-dependent ribonucleoside-diphosphate reductase [Alphaproteobacteria bacterium]MBT6384989.1 adenosylcobalamin-dependent ribonucleoside-diphosphate reduc